MAEVWNKQGTLCKLADDQVRIEIGPQVVELDCTDENLSNDVTHPMYQVGSRDAYGKFIRPDEMPAGDQKDLVRSVVAREKKEGVYGTVAKGEKMAVVDFRAVHAPHLWKIYELQETAEQAMAAANTPLVDEDGNSIMVKKFIKVDEVAGKEQALAVARALAATKEG